MTKHILVFCLSFLIAVSCSEEGEREYNLVPFEGEYIPVVYTIGSRKVQYPVKDCDDNVADFSSHLNEFISGNVLIGRIDCSQCPGFKGQYMWVSRCDQTYQSAGTWSTPDFGKTVSFEPTLLPDSTLQFSAVSTSTGKWKLRYSIGEEFVTVHYMMVRN